MEKIPEKMNYSTLNFTPEALTNSTTQASGILEYLNICVYSFSFLFGFPTHTYIIWLIVSGTGSGVAAEFFSLNLSVCEIFFSVNSLTYVLSELFSVAAELKSFSVGVITTGRPLFQSLICVERYLAVVHPVTFLKLKPLRYRVICCAVAWTLIFGSSMSCMYTLVAPNFVHLWFMAVQHFLFLFIQLFCIVAVLVALKQSGPGDRQREKENHMKRRAFLIIVLTTVSMIITYVPYNSAGFYTIITGKRTAAQWLPGVFCYVLCGFVQPVLYLHHTGKLPCPFLF